MRLFRFMGDQELKRFLSGEVLVCHRIRSVKNGTEDGFVFFDDSKPIEQRIKYVIGKADLSNVVEFDVLNPSRFIKTTGAYRNPGEDKEHIKKLGLAELFYLKVNDGYPAVIQKEYLTRVYSYVDLKILRIGTPGMFTGISEGEYMVKWEGVEDWKKKKESCLP